MSHPYLALSPEQTCAHIPIKGCGHNVEMVSSLATTESGLCSTDFKACERGHLGAGFVQNLLYSLLAVQNRGLLEQNIGASDFDTNAPTMGMQAGGSSLAGLNILSQESALSSIQTIDNAIEKVSDMRADLGAKQNRLNSTVNNLSNVVTNTEASKSRILDTDYGKETTNLARAQIISQAATAMLAQANQSAQSVLSLLK